MEPWAPQRPSQPQGRPMTPSKDANRGLQSGLYRPHSHPLYHQWQDARRSSKPQQEPRADHQQSHYAPRPGEWSQPVSRADYLKGPYPSHVYSSPEPSAWERSSPLPSGLGLPSSIISQENALQKLANRPIFWGSFLNYDSLLLDMSRSGYEDPYQRYHTPTPRDEYAYGNYYYHGHPQLLQEERAARQRSPSACHEGYGDQKYFSEHRREQRNSLLGTKSETQFQHTSKNPYQDGPASISGQEQPGEFFPESEGQKQKPSLTSKSNLLQHHESGLSSSSYELSQYMTDAPEQYEPMVSASWRPIQDDDTSAAVPKTPMRFYIPHVSVSFGPGGQLVCVSPNSPADGQTALVEVHSMEVLLNDSVDQEEMRGFPGPLIREDIHKVDIMTFCQKKAAQCLRSESPGSRDSALLWQLLVLLCRQNGSMVGSDIAELLMQDCRKLEKYKRQPPMANLINLTDDEHWPEQSSGTRNLLTGEIPPSVETPAQIVEKFTKLLYYGRKKEALEWAMKNHLWGHALFLASKMDPRTYNWVMSGFTSTLALNDPLQTLFQLMSGRIPQASTCCGDKQWGDWRPHLAVILSNQAGDTELYQRAIVSMGDTLAGKGLVEAAHFCYLMAPVPFGHYTVKTDHLTLVGSNHSQEFLKFATIEAIQRTEIFEYCQMLGRPKSFIPSFQVYKLLYASRLADYGLASQALHYCEAIGAAVLSQGGSSHPVLLAELIKLAEKLKLSDPLVLERRGGDRDLEPDWLVQLRRKHKELEQTRARCSRIPDSTPSDIYGARATTATPYQDLSGYQSYTEDPGYSSSLWPTPEQSGLPQPIPQQPFPQQRDTYSEREGSGPRGTPVPLYSVPANPSSVTSGGSSSNSVAVTGPPGGRVEEEMPRIHPAFGENVVAHEPLQDPEGLEVISGPQAPPTPGAQRFSEDSTKSAMEDEERSSDGEDKPSHQDASQRGKPGEGKENSKRSGFGWFSWFRSKPANSMSTSGDEGSSGSSDSEQESPRASPPGHAGQGLSPTPAHGAPSLPGASTFSRGTGGSSPQGSSNNSGVAKGAGIGGSSEVQGASSEFYSQPGALPPPPTLQGAVPLYNPSQVPQLPAATSLSRPNRLAQRRYPTQPC
ncbi:protein transport protein Sec16B isoform X3 [Meriones unguiculatus]|uniref:protein transport protein Sec16B isoform X3 n=1 Tax=Meriones unguiculatus TaxID=10047 RepID=UPI000B4EF0AB|nr:protein transport protein Sec16B isoform X3 [Meriones unguiculatus]